MRLERRKLIQASKQRASLLSWQCLMIHLVTAGIRGLLVIDGIALRTRCCTKVLFISKQLPFLRKPGLVVWLQGSNALSSVIHHGCWIVTIRSNIRVSLRCSVSGPGLEKRSMWPLIGNRITCCSSSNRNARELVDKVGYKLANERATCSEGGQLPPMVAEVIT